MRVEGWGCRNALREREGAGERGGSVQRERERGKERKERGIEGLEREKVQERGRVQEKKGKSLGENGKG